MAVFERPVFFQDWTPSPPGTLIKRVLSFDGTELHFAPPVGPKEIHWITDSDFTTLEYETAD